MKIQSKILALMASLVISVGSMIPSLALAAGPNTVNLGSAGTFSALAKSGISTTGTTAVTGNIGVSPIAASAITGFGLIMDSSNTFASSALVSGKIYAADYTPPTPSVMSTAISNMETAYTDAAGRTSPTAIDLGAGNIGGMTLVPGLYKWSTGVTIPTDLTLSGGAGDVWIFQIAGNLTLNSATKIILSGGAQSENIFWQVAGQTTIGTTAVFSGIILDQTAIVLQTGATLNGRALAQTAVTLDSSVISISSTPVVPVPVLEPVPVTAPVAVPVVVATPIYVPYVPPTSTSIVGTPTVITTTTTVVTTSPILPYTGFAPTNTFSFLWFVFAACGAIIAMMLSYSILKRMSV